MLREELAEVQLEAAAKYDGRGGRLHGSGIKPYRHRRKCGAYEEDAKILPVTDAGLPLLQKYSPYGGNNIKGHEKKREPAAPEVARTVLVDRGDGNWVEYRGNIPWYVILPCGLKYKVIR